MGKSLLLSIIIPVYNRQHSLDILLSTLSESIQKNDFIPQVEVIVIDDCSQKKIIFPNLFIPVILQRNKKNAGAPFSREQGFKLSQGQFVHFHDSDDSIENNWLVSVVDTLQANPNLDLFMTGRVDRGKKHDSYRYQKYFHKKVSTPDKIKSRLIYRNCMGPLGGVTFSRRILERIEFKPFSSCQDWQMYIDAIKHSQHLLSRPEVKFLFNKTGDDRISYHPRKKILGHLQLAKITSKQSIFNKNIRLFYLYTCKQHIFAKGGGILHFYKKNRFKVWFYFVVISIYWRAN